MSEKRSGHPYWIHETVMGCGDVLATWGEEKQQRTVAETAGVIVGRKPAHIFIAGTGSSHLAALAQCHAFQRIAGIPASAWVTSELRGYPPPHFDRTAILLLNTTSGKSPVDVKLVEEAKERGVYTIGVTDVDDSPFAMACDRLLIGRDGPKREFPSTRTYASAMYRTLLVAAACARAGGAQDSAGEFHKALAGVPHTVKGFLKEFEATAKAMVPTFADRTAYFIVSSGPNMSTAHEGAMGLTQGTGRPAAAYNVDEYMHGPVQSLGEGHCVVAIAPPGPFQAKIAGFSRAARRIGAKVLMVAPEGSDALKEADAGIAMPSGIPEVVTPVVYCAPFWLLGYYFSLHYGRDPDSLSMESEAFKSSGLAELKKMV